MATAVTMQKVVPTSVTCFFLGACMARAFLHYFDLLPKPVQPDPDPLYLSFCDMLAKQPDAVQCNTKSYTLNLLEDLQTSPVCQLYFVVVTDWFLIGVQDLFYRIQQRSTATATAPSDLRLDLSARFHGIV